MSEKYKLEFLKDFVTNEKQNLSDSFLDAQHKLSDMLCNCSSAIEKEYKKLKEYRDKVLKCTFTTRIEIQNILRDKVKADNTYFKVSPTVTDNRLTINISFIDSPYYDLEHIFTQITEYKRFIFDLKIETMKHAKKLIDLFNNEDDNKFIRLIEKTYGDMFDLDL